VNKIHHTKKVTGAKKYSKNDDKTLDSKSLAIAIVYRVAVIT
jgi:hypothetical protein